MNEHDDPRLTGLALGERPTDDVEDLLAKDPGARTAFEESQKTAAALREALATETGAGLGAEGRAAVERAAAEIVARAERTEGRRRFVRPLFATACAAMVLLAFGVSMKAGRSRLSQDRLHGATLGSADDAARIAAREGVREQYGDPPVMSFGTDAKEETQRTLAGHPSGGGGSGARKESEVGNEERPLFGAEGEGAVARRELERFRGPGGAPPPALRAPADSSPAPAGPPSPSEPPSGQPIALGPPRGGLNVAGKPRVDRLVPNAAPGFSSPDYSRPGGRAPDLGPSNDAFDALAEAGFVRTLDEQRSTFSIDVDTASYAIVRRMLRSGALPPAGAVRVEEMVNYFPYSYEPPLDDAAFAVHVEAADCPWNLKHRLVRIALKGREIAARARPTSNLVFLIDVSGSMRPDDRLPLVKQSLRMLVEEELRAEDRVAIVVYAGASGLVLSSTSGSEKGAILSAIDRLEAGGSTNGGAGIELAYAEATRAFVPGGVNRVVLATDGDWNVGITDRSSLVRMIEEKAKSGVFLTVLGYGMGNLKDATLEQLADKGNGNYGYVDSLAEARRLLVDQAGGTLVTIAKDVKIQVEFNPSRVAAYRLVGYENRRLATQDFNDDKKDAGEIGAGHSVTAFYEVVPPGVAVEQPEVSPLRYQPPRAVSGSDSAEMLNVALRWKPPAEDVSRLRQVAFVDEGRSYAQASGDFKFAAAVASFAQLLRGSAYKGSTTYEGVIELANEGVGQDERGYRREFVSLVEQAKKLSGGR